MALRGPQAVGTTITCPLVGAKQAIAAQGAGAPTNGFINCVDTHFGFKGRLFGALANTGTVTLEITIPDSAGNPQTYSTVLAAGEPFDTFDESIDLAAVVVYGSVASQKLQVVGSH